MFLLIDKTRMGFCFRHPQMRTLFDLAHIELSESHVVVFNEEDAAIEGWPSLHKFSDLELKLLYRNTTDCISEFNMMTKATLIRAITDAIAKLPISDADPVEADAQASSISDREDDVYRYVKGSTKPRVQPDDYKPPLLKSGQRVVVKPVEVDTPTKPAPKPAQAGGVKQHIRKMFTSNKRFTLAELTGGGQFSESSIKTALSDLKNPKYAGGELLLTARTKLDGVDYYVME